MSAEIQIAVDRFGLFAGGSVSVSEMSDRALQAGLNFAAEAIAEKAQQLLGVDYPPASKPGEPPHRRTGALQASVQAIPNSAPNEALVVADTPYAAVLEFGGGKIAARPYMRPAVESVKQGVGIEAAMKTVFDR